MNPSPIRLLKLGTRGADVGRWQTFLRGLGYSIRADGAFGPRTEKATQHFQRKRGLVGDGVVGQLTLGLALNEGMGGVVESELEVPQARLRPIGRRARARLFGAIEYRAAPTAKNPERIVVEKSWRQKNLARVEIGMVRTTPSGTRVSRREVQVHRLVKDSFIELWRRWDEAGLLERVVTWNGSYVPRFIRGSHKVLSNHSWGTAFDINGRWNRLGHTPAAAGREGSVLELVPIANELGWYWGGALGRRPDGMHFEATRAAIR